MEVFEIVKVEGNIEHAEREFAVLLGEDVEQPFRDFIAAAADADECDRLALGFLADGGGQTFHACGDVFGGEGARLHGVVSRN